MPITLSPKSLRLLRYIAEHGGDPADEQLASSLERAIEKVARHLHARLLQEQGTPYGESAALKAIADYRLAHSGEPEPAAVDVQMAGPGSRAR
jgi:hypothetical protein